MAKVGTVSLRPACLSVRENVYRDEQRIETSPELAFEDA
jgi:hypothetical protein